MADATKFGMMEGAYFVGRKEILEWINSTLKLNLSKVEQTASGAVAIQLLDMMYPGRVPMSKVNWEAKNDYEFINNYKVLQKCFDLIGIDKYIDVDKLVRAKYQDNLEFMQWFKRFYEVRMGDNGAVPNYDPVAARARGRGGTKAAENMSQIAKAPPRLTTTGETQLFQIPQTPATLERPPSSGTRHHRSNSSVSIPDSCNKENHSNPGNTMVNAGAETPTHIKTPLKRQQSSSSPKATSTEPTALQPAIDQGLLKENEEMHKNALQMQMDAEALQKERDYYFDKLVDIEMFLQEKEALATQDGSIREVLKGVFEILYNPQDGPDLVVNEEGKLLRGDEGRQYKQSINKLRKALSPLQNQPKISCVDLHLSK